MADTVSLYGAACVKDVIRSCGAGGGCNSCHVKIRALIEAHGFQSRVEPVVTNS